jgi:hypothetical protein
MSPIAKAKPTRVDLEAPHLDEVHLLDETRISILRIPNPHNRPELPATRRLRPSTLEISAQRIARIVLARPRFCRRQARRWRLEAPYLSFPNQRLYERLGYRIFGEQVPPCDERQHTELPGDSWENWLDSGKCSSF